MLRSDLCDYSEAYVWVKGRATINLNGYLSDETRKFVFKNNAPFQTCVSKINGKLVENAEDLDVVMPIYNLLEYSKNYEKTSGSLFNYYRDEPRTDTEGDGDQLINFFIKNSKSFDYKLGITGRIPADGANVRMVENLEIAIPLKHLGNLKYFIN